MDTCEKTQFFPAEYFARLVEIICEYGFRPLNVFLALAELDCHHESSPKISQAEKRARDALATREKELMANLLILANLLGRVCQRVPELIEDVIPKIKGIPDKTLRHWVAICFRQAFLAEREKFQVPHDPGCVCQYHCAPLDDFLQKRKLVCH